MGAPTKAMRDRLNRVDERTQARMDASMAYLRDAHERVRSAEAELAEARRIEDRCAAQAFYNGATWTVIGEVMELSASVALRRARATAEAET